MLRDVSRWFHSIVFAGRTRTSTLRSASISASEHEKRCRLPRIPRPSFRYRRYWRPLLCGRVWMLFGLAIHFVNSALVLRLF